MKPRSKTERLRPSPESSDPWGELRSLAHASFTGEEQWEEWRPLIDGLAAREPVWTYLQDVWSAPSEIVDLESARRAFLFRALVAQERAHRAAQSPRLHPCMSSAEIDTWLERQTQRHDTMLARAWPEPALGPYLRACLEHLGAGFTSRDAFAHPDQGMFQTINQFAQWTLLKRYREGESYPETDGVLAASFGPLEGPPAPNDSWEWRPMSHYVRYLLEEDRTTLDPGELPTQRSWPTDAMAEVEGDVMFGFLEDAREMLYILPRGPWADHLVGVWLTDEPFCGDTDIDVVWPVLSDGTHVLLEDHVPGALTSHGHLIDWLDAILRG